VAIYDHKAVISTSRLCVLPSYWGKYTVMYWQALLHADIIISYSYVHTAPMITECMQR